MNLFVISSNIPFPNHDTPGVTAVHIVVSELVREICGAGHKVTFQLLFNVHRKGNTLNADEAAAMQALAASGVTLCDPIFPDAFRVEPATGAGRLKAVVDHGVLPPKLDHYYPTARLRSTMEQRIRQAKADAVVTIWSPEGLAATAGITDVPRIAYHGDIDHQPQKCRLSDEDLFGKSTFLEKRDVSRLRTVHMQLMQGVDAIANVTASNADFYREHGHAHSTYVRNTWPDRDDLVKWSQPSRPARIIGHVGYLNRTGSAFGLRFLLRDLAPELQKALQGIDYEIGIIGGGELPASLREAATQPHIRMLGYVPDLDAEMAACDVMLLLNNAGPYQAAYTRHLVAWSRGLCLIAHSNSRKAIPEIADGENAFMGSNAKEVAHCVKLALTDSAANARVRAGGRRTFEQYFTPTRVAAGLLDVIRQTVEQRVAIR